MRASFEITRSSATNAVKHAKVLFLYITVLQETRTAGHTAVEFMAVVSLLLAVTYISLHQKRLLPAINF